MNTAPTELPVWGAILMALLFPFLFVGLWCSICLLLSYIGGWQRLATRFPAGPQKPSPRHPMQRGKVGLVSYKGCLTVASTDEGLYLAVMAIFRTGHPPLFIPWSEIHHLKTHRFLWVETLSAQIGTPQITTIKLSPAAFAQHPLMAHPSPDTP